MAEKRIVGKSSKWIDDGKTGILVPPEDPDVIEKAIRRALTDDELVDKASEINYRVAGERPDHIMLRSKAVEMYKTVAHERGIECEN